MAAVKVNDSQTAFVMLLKEFIESYARNQNMPLNQWLSTELKAHMPEKSAPEINTITDGIISSIESIQAKRESLDRSISRGRTKSEWFAKELKASQSAENVQEIHDSAVNAQRDILAKTGVIDAEFAYTPPESPATTEQAAQELQNAAVLGSTIDAEGYDLAGEVLRDFASPYSKFITDTLKSGNTTGLKAAASGAIKTGSERGMLPTIPVGTPEDIAAGVGYMAVEKVKAAAKKLPFVEVVEDVERNALSVASVAADTLKTKGASIGQAIGQVFGPVGSAVGGVIGGVVGYFAGSKVARVVVEKVQEVRRKVVETVTSYVAPVFKKVVEGVKNVGKKILGWLFG